MRLVSLLFVLALAASCGQETGGGGGKSSSSESGGCNLNGSLVACESIAGADGQGVDILESMIDVPIKIENSEITFLADKTAVSTGRRIECKLGVKNGEIYRFAIRGEKLMLMTSTGSYELTKTSEGPGLHGNWRWNGYVDQGTHVLRNISFVGDNRMIMRTNCEL